MYLLLEVTGFALENVASEDLEKHGEPEIVQCAHHTQKDGRNRNEGLVFGLWERHLCENEPNHLWQAVNARHKPSDHAADEGHGT